MSRPFRLDAFDCFAEQIAAHNISHALELGSGPGFLAKYLCDRNADLTLTLLDFSEAMHELARKRLAGTLDRIEFLTRDFKRHDWAQGLDKQACIISNQAVHELRHKRHAPLFFQQVASLLQPGGVFLMCDHFYGEGAMSNTALYMTPEEQLAALSDTGLHCSVVFKKGSLQLVQAQL